MYYLFNPYFVTYWIISTLVFSSFFFVIPYRDLGLNHLVPKRLVFTVDSRTTVNSLLILCRRLPLFPLSYFRLVPYIPSPHPLLIVYVFGLFTRYTKLTSCSLLPLRSLHSFSRTVSTISQDLNGIFDGLS